MLTPAPKPDASLLTWAQYYGAIGWPIFPCRGKAPLTTHGFHDANSEPWTIDGWWAQWPDANIGSPMGHGRWALDVDPRHGGDDTLFALERRYGPLPHTLLSHTGGGGNHQVWDEVTPIIHQAWKSQQQQYSGLDIIGAGGYIILPPSVHPDTGRVYCWDVVDGIDEIEPQPAPAWLLALVSAPAPASPPVPDVSAPILAGERNNVLAAQAIRLRRAGATLDEIYAVLCLRNRQCQPPLTDDELRQIAYSKGRYAPDATFEVPHAGGNTEMPPSNGGPAPATAWGTTPAATYRLPLTDFADMLTRTYPLPQWLIRDLIPEGLVFFVGSPKSSKTYLAHSLALSLVQAMTLPDQIRWLGHYPLEKQGPVIYVTLEDDEDDSFWRARELAPSLTSVSPAQFMFVHDITIPYLGQGLTEVLTEQVMEVYHPALVVLDPISYLYAPTRSNSDQFVQVKQMLLPLRWMGKKYHCVILGVDHRRKKSADDIDIFETQYGSNAKVAVNDAQLVIVRDDKDITVHCQVRKARNQTLALGFEFLPGGTAEWTWKGTADGLINQGIYGELRMKVLAALQALQAPMTIDELLTACALPNSRDMKQAIDQVLRRSIKAGEVVKGQRRGQYLWAGGN